MGIALFETIFRRHVFNGNKGRFVNWEDYLFRHFYDNQPMKFWIEITKDKQCKSLLSYYKD